MRLSLLGLMVLIGACGDGPMGDVCVDADGDGYGEGALCLGPDCDDDDDDIHPGAFDEAADGEDADCDGGDVCLVDADNDGFSRGNAFVDSADLDCDDDGEATFAMPTNDCDDGDDTRYPNAPETFGDGIDQSCDGREACFRDRDRDGARTAEGVDSDDLDCDDDGEARASAPIDCADTPDADAACGGQPGQACSPLIEMDDCTLPGVDENCDGVVDDDGVPHYRDFDGDNFGDPNLIVNTCTAVSGYVTNDDDCDDRDDGRWQVSMRFPDVDADGFGADLEVPACEGTHVPVGFAQHAGDCEPLDATAYPGAPELPEDGVDQDCMGGDLVPSDVTGIFVAPPPSGDNGNAGTRVAPVATIDRALQIATGTQVIFVADGTYTQPGATVTRSIFGGYDAEFTSRGTGADTDLVGEFGIWCENASVAIERLSIRSMSAASDARGVAMLNGSLTVRDVDILAVGAFNSMGVRAFASRAVVDRSVIEAGHSVSSMGVFARGGRTVVTRSRITNQGATSSGSSNAAVAVYFGVDESPALVAVVGNLLRASLSGSPTVAAGVELFNVGTRALIANNTILLGPADTDYSQSRLGVYLFSTTHDVAADVINNVFTATAGSDPVAGVYSNEARMALTHNAFFLPEAGSCAVASSGTCASEAQITACTFPRCISSANNRYDDPALTGQELLLSPASVCIDAGFTPTFATALFSTDRFGTARPIGAAFDIGAHEYED